MKLWVMPYRATQDGGEFWQSMVPWRTEWKTTSAFLPWEPHVCAQSLSHVWLFARSRTPPKEFYSFVEPTRLLCPWNFLDKKTAVGCHFLLQGSSGPRDWTSVSCTSCIGRWILFYHQATWEALRTPWTVWKGKRYDTRWTFQLGRCPICYWRRVELH